MKYQAIIFDLDGVICHTDSYHFQAWKALADKLGIHFDETVNNQLRGVSRMESLDIILHEDTTGKAARLTKDEKEKLADEKNQIYRELLKNMSEKDLSYEVKETLEQLRDKGLLLAIGSSSKNACFILKQIGLGDFFDTIVDGNQIQRSKPDPEVFTKAAQKIDVPFRNCLVVEDAVSGVQAATAAGMDSAAYGDAARYQIATHKLSTFSDLVGLTG